MKKVLFIIWSHSLGGGAEALLTTIVNSLNPKKYTIGIIEIYHSNIKKESVNSNIKVYDPITYEGDPEYRKKLYYIYQKPDTMIRRYIPSDYDLYVSFNYQLPSFLLPDGTRNIAWIHGAVFDLAGSGMEKYRNLQSQAFDKALKIISISDVTTSSIQELFPRHAHKIIEIYNSVNVRQIRQKAQQSVGVNLKHPSVIYVGRLDENKNPLRMLEIFQGVLKRQKEVYLYFLGKGELESAVKKKAEEYKIQDRIHYFGYMENPFPIIRQADVLCMTSKSEGFPMSLLESVALHVPFVSTEVGGARILANGGCCGRVYSSNEEAIDCILEILETPKELLVQESENVICNFDLGIYISKIEKLFDEVLGMNVMSDQITIWDDVQKAEELPDRNYYYRFPEGFVEKGQKIVLYGAGDIGRNYYHYIKETNVCQITAWVDTAAEKYRDSENDVQTVEPINSMDYDAILIAVMKENVAQEIRRNLCERGIPNDKILWTVPVF